MKIYLDACCLARLTDDQSQPRIREEAAAIERLFAAFERGELEWVTSEVLESEIARNPSVGRRCEAEAMLSFASRSIQIDEEVARRALALQSVGYGAYDALHLAAAEAAGAAVLLTTDDRFLKRAARGDGQPLISVENPLSWSKERLS